MSNLIPIFLALIFDGITFPSDGPKPKHPFQHLVQIPAHDTAKLSGSNSLYFDVTAISNNDSGSEVGDWSSEFDASMLFAEIGSEFSLSENINFNAGLESGKIASDEGILLFRNTTSFLKENDLGYDLSFLSIGAKIKLFENSFLTLSVKESISFPAGGSNAFLTAGANSSSHSGLITINVWRTHFITYNGGVAVPRKGDVFDEGLRLALVKFFSGSYFIQGQSLGAGAIYETSTPLLKRPETINERYSSVALSIHVKSGGARYNITLARGTVEHSFDTSITVGYTFEF